MSENQDVTQPQNAVPNQNDPQLQAVQLQAKNNNGILAIILSLFFIQIGGAVCWYCFGKRSAGYCVRWFLVYTVLQIIAGLLCLVAVGAVLLPIISVVIVIHTYKVSVNPFPQAAQ